MLTPRKIGWFGVFLIAQTNQSFWSYFIFLYIFLVFFFCFAKTWYDIQVFVIFSKFSIYFFWSIRCLFFFCFFYPFCCPPMLSKTLFFFTFQKFVIPSEFAKKLKIRDIFTDWQFAKKQSLFFSISTLSFFFFFRLQRTKNR